jgi:hypothetical protein
MKSRLIALTIVFAVTAAKADERLISFIDGNKLLSGASRMIPLALAPWRAFRTS